MKLSNRLRRVFYCLLALMFLTGSFWLYLEFFVRTRGEFGNDHHPWQNVLIRLHGAFSYFFVIALGYLLRSHVRPALRGERNRQSGYFILGVFSFMVLTAVIQLFGPESVIEDWSAQLHRWVGLGLPVLLGIHVYLGKKTRKN